MSHSTPSSPSILSSNFGVLSASDIESHSERASQSDSDFEVVLVQPTSALTISDSDSGSLVSAPTDSLESSDDEHIMVPNISQSTPNTPRPPSLMPARLSATPRPASVVFARPIIESGHDSEASDREDDSSNASTYESDSDSDSDSGSVVHARARTVTITNDRLEAPLAIASTTSLGTVHANGSTATIRPAALSRPSRRATPAGMHTPAITTNTIMGILSSAPLSPPTPSDGGEIPYAPFTAAPTVTRPAPTPRPASVPSSSIAKPPPPPATKSSPAKKVTPNVAVPPIPIKKTSKKEWAAMNVARVKLGLEPLQHLLRMQNNAAIKARKKGDSEAAARARVLAEAEAKARNKAKAKAQAEAKAKAKSEAKAKAKAETEAKAKAKAGAKAKANASKTKPVVAPRPTVGASPITSEDEAPRMRASMFSPVNDVSVRSESPDEGAYDAAIKQLDEHMSSPPEHPTATYRYLLNRALLLEFRVCTPETLPTSHGAAIAMVKANVHINVLDYVAKRKEGFNGLRTVMLANAKALRKDVQKRRMPVKVVKSLGLHSLLVLT